MGKSVTNRHRMGFIPTSYTIPVKVIFSDVTRVTIQIVASHTSGESPRTPSEWISNLTLNKLAQVWCIRDWGWSGSPIPLTFGPRRA